MVLKYKIHSRLVAWVVVDLLCPDGLIQEVIPELIRELIQEVIRALIQEVIAYPSFSWPLYTICYELST